MPTPKQLLADLEATQRARTAARERIIQEIRARMTALELTPYRLADAAQINRGNLYNLVSNGKWNATVAQAALAFLSRPTPPRRRRR